MLSAADSIARALDKLSKAKAAHEDALGRRGSLRSHRRRTSHGSARSNSSFGVSAADDDGGPVSVADFMAQKLHVSNTASTDDAAGACWERRRGCFGARVERHIVCFAGMARLLAVIVNEYAILSQHYTDVWRAITTYASAKHAGCGWLLAHDWWRVELLQPCRHPQRRRE